MIVLIIGLIAFLGIHLVRVVAPQWREQQIAQRGEGPWKGIYSVISALGLIGIIYGYSLARGDAAYLFDPPQWSRSLSLIVMPVSIILITVADFRPGYIKKFVRHPMLIAVLIWSGSHLLANGDSASALLFGGFLIWSIIDLFSVWRRPATPLASPVVWPDLAGIALGLIITWLIMSYLHEWLIGVSII